MLQADHSAASESLLVLKDVRYALHDHMGNAPKRRADCRAMKMFPPLQPPAELPLVDNMFAPEILAGGMSGLSVLNGIVTITLENARCDHSKTPPPLERIVVGRIALPIPAAQALLSGLYQFLAQHGLNPLAANPQVTCQ